MNKLIMDKKIFNRVYAKFFKADYWQTKEFIGGQLKQFKARGIIIPMNQVKKLLANEKNKCFNMILNRLEVINAGGIKQYPAYREKFTFAILKELKKLEA
jgi:hypothetical protein